VGGDHELRARQRDGPDQGRGAAERGYKSATLKVYYPAITASTKQLLAGLGQNPSLTAELVFITLDANSVPIEKYTFWSVKLSPDGDVNLIGDDYRTVQIKGEIIADTTQATGYSSASSSSSSPAPTPKPRTGIIHHSKQPRRGMRRDGASMRSGICRQAQ
jgi:hypothetical protein